MNLDKFIRFIITIWLFIGLSMGQKIVQMNGSYDLDGDNLLEFISLEMDPKTDIYPTTVRYYEIDADGYQTLIWELLLPLHWKDIL